MDFAKEIGVIDISIDQEMWADALHPQLPLPQFYWISSESIILLFKFVSL